MAQRRVLSIDLGLLGDTVRANPNHSAITVGNNGKKYLSVVVWDKDEKDQYDNDCSIQINSKKDANEPKVYLGNGRIYGAGSAPQPQAPAQAPQSTSPDLPF
jgi:hypothetical protein